MVRMLRIAFPLTICVVAMFAMKSQTIHADDLAASLQERDQLSARFVAARDAAKLDEAISLANERATLESKLLAAVLQASPHDKELLSKVRLWHIETAQWLAGRYEERGDAAKAKRSREAVLQSTSDQFGKDHWQTTDARVALANAEAIARLSADQRSRVVQARQLMVESDKLADAGKPTEAVARLDTVVVALRETLGEKHPEYALALKKSADLIQDIGDLPRSKRLYEEALTIRREILGLNHPETARSIDNLATQFRVEGDFSKAQPLFQESLEIRREVLGEKHLHFAYSVHNLGTAYQSLGDYAKAETLKQKAVELLKAARGEKSADYAKALHELGELYVEQGDYARAKPLLKQALEVRGAALGVKHPDYGYGQSGLATLYLHEGDYAQAEPLFREALENHRIAFGEKSSNYAWALHNLAWLLHEKGEPEKAIPLYRQSLAIKKVALGEKHVGYAMGLNNLAYAFNALGDAALAEPLLRQAREIYREKLGNKHADYARSVNNLANSCRDQGKFTEAEPLYREALEVRKAALGDKHPNYAWSLYQFARFYAAQKDFERAEVPCREALLIMAHNLDAISMAQSERQQLAMQQKTRKYLDEYFAIAMNSGKFEQPAYQALLRWKGIVWARQRQIRAVAGKPELSPLVSELQAVAARLAKLATTAPNAQTLEAWRRQLAELTHKKEDLEARLAERSAEFRKARQLPTIDDLTAALPADAALVDFLEYAHYTPSPPDKPGVGLSDRRLLAFVVRKNQSLRLFDLGAAAPLAENAQKWRRSFGQSPDARMAGEALRQQVWDPLAPKLEGAKLVIVSLDGVLGRFPLAALPAKTAGKYLLEEWAIASIPVPQVLPELLREQGAKGGDGLKNLLLLGGVDYEANASESGAAKKPKKEFGRRPDRSAGWRNFDPLDGSKGEVAAIEKMYRETFGGDGLTTLEKALASEERFVAEASQHRYLHLATHGFFAPPELRSALANAADQKAGGLRAESSQLVGQHPSLLSGVALAGANRTPSDDREDGILTAEEVQTLDLRQAELVALSACETGLGEVAGGEGVLGLQRAFQIAGARTTVASLWKVDDTQTRVLMERFYRNLWENDMTKLEALREAQLWMLKEGKRGLVSETPEEKGSDRLSPYYWAAFVLSGDWR